jgi:hypothetical protein
VLARSRFIRRRSRCAAVGRGGRATTARGENPARALARPGWDLVVALTRPGCLVLCVIVSPRAIWRRPLVIGRAGSVAGHRAYRTSVYGAGQLATGVARRGGGSSAGAPRMPASLRRLRRARPRSWRSVAVRWPPSLNKAVCRHLWAVGDMPARAAHWMQPLISSHRGRALTWPRSR